MLPAVSMATAERVCGPSPKMGEALHCPLASVVTLASSLEEVRVEPSKIATTLPTSAVPVSLGSLVSPSVALVPRPPVPQATLLRILAHKELRSVLRNFGQL